jgi:hypothetical protein
MADGTQILMEIEIGSNTVKLCSKLTNQIYLPFLQSAIQSILEV